jgi:hypothetical protein
MPHVLSFVHALNISWIKRVLDPDNYAPWKVLLTDVLEDLRLPSSLIKSLIKNISDLAQCEKKTG